MTHLPTQLARKLINRTNARGLLAVAICGAATLAITPASALADDDAASFWTQFAPSEDTRLIFVSSSEGNDNNSGFSPNEPVASLDKAYELLRDGYPDWMLLKRGDVWYDSFPTWEKSGRDVDEKMVVGAYGESTERPQVRPIGRDNGLEGKGDNGVRHVAFVGFHLEPKDINSDIRGGSGLGWGARSAEDLLFEDLYVGNFKTNVGLNAWGDGASLKDIRVNGCVIVDSWNNDGHSQGLFAKATESLTIENCVFDHNGWNTSSGAEPTIFNHNAYIQHDNTDVVALNNVFMRGSATGIQLRPGGQLSGNLFVANPVGFTVGAPNGYNLGHGASAEVTGNTVIHGSSMQNSQSDPRSVGAYFHNIRQAEVTGNIFAHNEIGYNGQLMLFSGSDNGADPRSVSVSNNISYAWHGPIQINKEQSPNDDDQIDIFNNTFIVDLSANNGNSGFNKSFVSVEPAVTHFLFDGNSYRFFGMHDSPFEYGHGLSTDEWQNQHEPTGNFEPLPSRPTGLTLSDYLAELGITGDLDDFAEIARSMSRTNQPGSASPASLHHWYKSHLIISQD